MANICQDEFHYVRPGDYFPERPHTGDCDACGAETVFVARVTKGEAKDAKEEYERRVARAANKAGL